MHRHPFDPLAAALGIVAIALGVLVATADIDDLGADAGIWLAIGVLVVGLGLIPWTRRHRPSDPDPLEDVPTPDP